MESLFKKFVYTGIGFLSLTTDKLKTTIEELVNDNKISREEGKRIVDDLLKNSEEKKQNFEEQTKILIEKIIESFGFAKAKELEELTKRVEILEKNNLIDKNINLTDKE